MLRKNHLRKGISAPIVLMFVGGFAMIGYSVLSMSNTNDKNSSRGAMKIQANNLAESGVQQIFDNIRLEMQSNGNYPMSVTNINYSAPATNSTIVLGQYSARVINVDTAMRDVNGQRHTTYTFDVEGTGAVSGVTSKMQAQFSGTVVHHLESIATTRAGGVSSADKIYFPTAAISAQEDIDIELDQGLRTYSPDGKSGHILANEGVSWKPKGRGSKNSFNNPNVIEVEGMILVKASKRGHTESDDGLGNANGRKNFKTASISAGGPLPASPADTVYGMDSSVEFADETAVNGWKATWLTTSQKTGATRYNTSITSNNVPERPGDQWRIIETPAYIDGDLEVLNGQQIRLMPKSSNNVENIVYVKGNIKNMGQLLNLGVTLVVEGKYTDGPSSEYKLDTQGSPYNTRKKVLEASAFVSLAKMDNAMTFNTNSSALTGVLYAANGGIKINGSNAEFSGLLAAGGRGNKGGIDIKTGGGASFVVRYEPDAAGAGDFDPSLYQNIDITMRPSSVAQAFSPTAITKWVQSK